MRRQAVGERRKMAGRCAVQRRGGGQESGHNLSGRAAGVVVLALQLREDGDGRANLYRKGFRWCEGGDLAADGGDRAGAKDGDAEYKTSRTDCEDLPRTRSSCAALSVCGLSGTVRAVWPSYILQDACAAPSPRLT